MSSETWWCRCIALSDATSRIRKFRKFCVQVKLVEVNQTFTAKDLGRGVIGTCSTGSISGTGTGTGTGIYIDLYRIPVLYWYNTCRNSENAFRIPTLIQRNLLQITNGWINGLQQIVGTQRVEIWGLLDGRHYKINMRFQFGERLIIIVNSRGLISPRREWDERVQVYGNHARWVGVNRIDVERIREVWGRRTELSIEI